MLLLAYLLLSKSSNETFMSSLLETTELAACNLLSILSPEREIEGMQLLTVVLHISVYI